MLPFFAGLGGRLDRAATLLHNPELNRTAPDFMQRVLDAPQSEYFIVYNAKPLVQVCSASKSGRLLRLTLDELVAVKATTAASASAPASFSPSVVPVVVGTWTQTGAPVVCVDATGLGDAQSILDALSTSGSTSTSGSSSSSSSSSAVSTRCGGTACRHLQSASSSVCESECSLQFVEGRDFLLGLSLAGKVRRARESDDDGTGTVTASEAPAAATAKTPLWDLPPHKLGWPLPFEEAALYGVCRSLLNWHSKNKFCGACGRPLVSVDGGVRLKCSGDIAKGGADVCRNSVYPRTDPVVISLVQSADGSRCLMGRQPGFPPGFYSILAGFLESGESVEEAVRREVFEESHIAVGPVRYYASQPWPITRGGLHGQIMLGCLATAKPGEDAEGRLVVDKSELEDAGWYSKDEVRALLQGFYAEDEPASVGGSVSGAAASPAASPAPAPAPAPGAGAGPSRIRLPGPFAIAHLLMKAWVNGEADDLVAK
jgi:NADH pyrophosphatase NudC (nudix superfamily)